MLFGIKAPVCPRGFWGEVRGVSGGSSRGFRGKFEGFQGFQGGSSRGFRGEVRGAF